VKDDKPIFELEEKAADLPDASPSQVNIEKLMPLASLQPGRYTLKVTVTDLISKKSVSPTAEFTVQ
jgi:hypothetical protein